MVAAGVVVAPPSGAGAGPKNTVVTDAQLHSYQAPALARDPGGRHRLAIGFQDGSNYATCYLAASDNGGADWQVRPLAGASGSVPLPDGFVQCQRPATAFGPDGTLYYAFSALQPLGGYRRYGVILLATSRDGGESFSAPVRVDAAQPPSSVAEAGTGDTLPRLAVGTSSGGGQGAVYVAWTRYSSDYYSQGDVLVAATTDGGKTFGPAVRVNGPDRHADQISISVGGDGRLFAAYNDNTPFIDSKGPGTANVKVSSSLDGGKTFSAPVTAGTVSSGRCQAYGCQEDSTGNYSHVPAISVAAGNSAGTAFVAMGSLDGPIPSADGYPPGDHMKIRVTSTKDGGRSWSTPVIVGVPPAASGDGQLFPVLSRAPNGRIDLLYYGVAPNGSQNTYMTSTTDGTRFSEPELVSEAATDMHVGPVFGNFPYDGGQGLASSDEAAYAAWADGRRGAPGNGKQDIVLAQRTYGGGSEGDFVTVVAGVVVVVIVALIAGVAVRRRRRTGSPGTDAGEPAPARTSN